MDNKQQRCCCESGAGVGVGEKKVQMEIRNEFKKWLVEG